MSYDNTNRGQLWGNTEKQSDSHPDFKGSINIDGVEYWLNGWKRKQGANPKSPALSLSVARKDGQKKTGDMRHAVSGHPLSSDNSGDPFGDIPF